MYYLLLLITAVLAYGFGSLSTLTIASLYVYRKNLRKLGRGNVWLSNFRRVYGFSGLLVLLLVELVKDILPILVGGWLLGIRGHADVGRIFAGFCVIVGRQWPLFYDLKGGFATIAVIVTAFMAELSVGFASLAAAALIIWLTRYIPLGTIAAAAVMLITSLLVVEQRMIIYLSLAVLIVVIVRSIPCIGRMAKGTETRLSLEKDLSYKFDSKF